MQKESQIPPEITELNKIQHGHFIQALHNRSLCYRNQRIPKKCVRYALSQCIWVKSTYFGGKILLPCWHCVASGSIGRPIMIIGGFNGNCGGHIGSNYEEIDMNNPLIIWIFDWFDTHYDPPIRRFENHYVGGNCQQN